MAAVVGSRATLTAAVPVAPVRFAAEPAGGSIACPANAPMNVNATVPAGRGPPVTEMFPAP